MLKHLLFVAAAAAAVSATALPKQEARAYYSTNPDGAVGKYATIKIDGEFNDWDESMIIATGGANDMCTAFKGAHENCVLDMYAVYAAWDDTKLYIGWQMVNTGDTWAREGDGPLSDYGRIGDVPLAVCLSVNPRNVSMTGLNAWGKGLWGDKATMGYGFKSQEAHVDRWLLMSGKPGQGAPAMFKAVDAQGNSDYNQGCMLFASNGINYKMKEGFHPSHLYRQMSYAQFDTTNGPIPDDANELVENIYDPEWYVDLLSDDYKVYITEHDMKMHDTKFDSFYEIEIPFKSLGIDRNYVETYGIGVRVVATRGESAIDCLPFDPSMVDNVWDEYGADKSTSHEKDDFDNITYGYACIGKLRTAEMSYPDPTETVDPIVPDDPDPVTSDYHVYLRNTVNWSNPMVWIWDAGNKNKNYTGGTWPGAAMSKTIYNGEELYHFAINSDDRLVTPKIIFSGNGAQSNDLDYVNNGIYELIPGNNNKYDGTVVEVAAVEEVETDISDTEAVYFNLQGVRVGTPTSGIFIRRQGNKVTKVVVR